MDLKPAADNPSKFERLVAELLSTQDYVGVATDEAYIFLGDWQLTLKKNGKWELS